MNKLIVLQDDNTTLYLQPINRYLAYGRELITIADQHSIVFEGYYKNYGPKGWQRVLLN